MKSANFFLSDGEWGEPGSTKDFPSERPMYDKNKFKWSYDVKAFGVILLLSLYP